MTQAKPDKITKNLKIEYNLLDDLILLKLRLKSESLSDVIQFLYNEFEGVNNKK